MITASCQFCEDIRHESSGQNTIIGLFGMADPVVHQPHLSSLYVLVDIHVSMDDRTREFGIRVVNQGGSHYVTPPQDFVDAVFKDSADYGLGHAVFPVTMSLVEQPVAIIDKFRLAIFLVEDGKDTQIGTFTVLPPTDDNTD